MCHNKIHLRLCVYTTAGFNDIDGRVEEYTGKVGAVAVPVEHAANKAKISGFQQRIRKERV